VTVRRDRAGAAALAALLAATVGAPAAAQDSAAEHAPEPTVSRYVPLHEEAQDLDRARDWGCTEGRSGQSGLRILFFGTQERGGVLRPPGTTAASEAPRVPAERAGAFAARWAQGFTACREDGAEAVLALGVNNKDDGAVSGGDAGAAWARIVTAATAAPSPGVEIAGAVDAEPGWSSPDHARAWVEAYTEDNPEPLYAANSADGCPWQGEETACNNGWDIADVHYLATGAADTLHAVPQIYRTDGVQAEQWARISAWGVHSGAGPLRFAGALSQQEACRQRSCDGTDNDPAAAWTQLWQKLSGSSQTRIEALPYSTDMRWP
jgi:hypothetical protein